MFFLILTSSVMPVLGLGVQVTIPSSGTIRTMLFDGWLAYWAQTTGFNIFQANVDVFRELCLYWYQFTGGPAPERFPGAADESAIISYAKGEGVKVYATIRGYAEPSVSPTLADPVLRAAHIAALVNLAVTMGYDGIDIDYEGLKAADRDNFSTFMDELSVALHAENKLLSVCVAAKTSEPGTWDLPKAQDWTRLGQICDRVRIMCYDYHWSTSKPGPLAPITWVDSVIKFAVTVIPREKVVMGVPFYGYDWIAGGAGTGVTWVTSMATASKYGATIQWDDTSKAPWFTYVDGGVRHEVWFENAKSLEPKLAVAKKYSIGGICAWRLGNEDPENWNVIRNQV